MAMEDKSDEIFQSIKHNLQVLVDYTMQVSFVYYLMKKFLKDEQNILDNDEIVKIFNYPEIKNFSDKYLLTEKILYNFPFWDECEKRFETIKSFSKIYDEILYYYLNKSFTKQKVKDIYKQIEFIINEHVSFVNKCKKIQQSFDTNFFNDKFIERNLTYVKYAFPPNVTYVDFIINCYF